jgi:hypothetical protein
MAYVSPTPLRAAQPGDSDNDLLKKLLNLWAAIANGDLTLATSAEATIGNVNVTPVVGTSVARTAHTTGLTASQTLVAANSNRAFLLIDNRSGDTMYYRYGADAATASVGGYDVRVPNGSQVVENGWDGAITFICGGSATTPGVNVSDVSL